MPVDADQHPALAEAILRLASPVALCVVDEDMKLVGYTPDWGQMLGWNAEAGEHLGEVAHEIGFLSEFVSPEDLPGALDRIVALAATGEDFSRPMLRADGSAFAFEGFCMEWRHEDTSLFFFMQRGLAAPDLVMKRAREAVATFSTAAIARSEPGETQRVTVRIDPSVDAAVRELVRDEGVTMNAMVQALLEGQIANHPVDPTHDVDGSHLGRSAALARAAAERRVARARAIDFDRRSQR